MDLAFVSFGVVCGAGRARERGCVCVRKNDLHTWCAHKHNNGHGRGAENRRKRRSVFRFDLFVAFRMRGCIMDMRRTIRLFIECERTCACSPSVGIEQIEQRHLFKPNSLAI